MTDLSDAMMFFFQRFLEKNEKNLHIQSLQTPTSWRPLSNCSEEYLFMQIQQGLFWLVITVVVLINP